MIVSQHIPAFFDIERQPDVVVESVKELLEIPWIKRWSQQADFVQFSFDFDFVSTSFLIAEMQDGRYWVIAVIREGIPNGLPLLRGREKS